MQLIFNSLIYKIRNKKEELTKEENDLINSAITISQKTLQNNFCKVINMVEWNNSHGKLIITINQLLEKTPDSLDDIKDNLYKLCRFYLDCKKIVLFLSKYYEISEEISIENLFVFVPLPTDSKQCHIEANLLDQLIKQDKYISSSEEKELLKNQHMGISMLSCLICWKIFKNEKLEHLLIGSHGKTAPGGWGLPQFFLEKEYVEFFSVKLLPQTVELIKTATGKERHGVSSESYFSGDEEELYEEAKIDTSSTQEFFENIGVNNVISLGNSIEFHHE